MARAADTGIREMNPEIVQWESEALAWMDAKSRADAAKKEMDTYRPSLMQALADEGIEDENGHRTLELTHVVGKWSGIQRQRRVSESQDMDTINRILEEKGLKDRCIEMVPQVNNDAIYACLYEGLLTEDEVYAMFPEKVTYALVAVKP